MTNKTKGIVLMIASTFFFALMGAFVKAIPNISIAQKIFFRNIYGAVFLGLYIYRKKSTYIGSNVKLLIIRCVFGLTGVIMYYYTISKLPLSDASLLNRTSPIFVIIMSVIFLGEKTNKHQAIAMIVGIIGAAFVIKPQFDYTVIPALIGLGSAIAAAAAYVALRGLRSYAPAETIVFAFSFFSTVGAIPYMLFRYNPPTKTEWLVLLGLGVSATIAQLLMTFSYRYAEASELAVYGYGNIVFSTILGILFWSEIPDILSILGGSLIIFSGVISYLGKNSKDIDSTPKDIVE